MADLDPELVERVIRWCAQAGRQTGTPEIRAALSTLGWDAILNVRALLADPPPARPLGPFALADLARGTPADVAAEREREGRYRHELDDAPAEGEGGGSPASGPGAPAGPPRAGRPRRGVRRPTAPVVRRKRDLAAPADPLPPSAPAFERLLDPEGRAVLERLIREHGARRAFLLGALAGWRRADGGAPADAELDLLLDHHGLARAFAHRERDELLHALRAARGERAGAAARVGLTPEAFQAALERLGATEEAERLRGQRRTELRARATIAERCRLLAAEADRLADLGLLAEFEADLRARLGEHLRALRAGGGGALALALARSVSLEVEDVQALAARLGIELGPAGPARAAATPRPPGPRGAARPLGRGSPARPPRPRPSIPRPPGAAAAPRASGKGRGAPRPPARGAGAPPRGTGAPPRGKGRPPAAGGRRGPIRRPPPGAGRRPVR